MNHRTPPPPLHVHGLAGDETAPVWPPLTRSEVADVLAGFPDLADEAVVEWRSPRPLSAAARVRVGQREVFVKRQHEAVRNAAELATEHAYMAHLRERGIPVPRVLADIRGRTAIARGPWTYEVQAIPEGVDRFRDKFSWSPLTNPALARSAGRMLARLHIASRGFNAKRDTFILVSRDDLLRAPDLAASLMAQFPYRPALANYLQARDWRKDLAPIINRQQALQPTLAELPSLWTHNDWHVSNLFFTDDSANAEVSAVLDFGLAAPNFALYDLATAIERNAIAWLELERGMDAIHPRTAALIIDGYTSILPLTKREQITLAALLPIVHLEFALSELEYFVGVTREGHAADVAYDTFLLGHAAWFDTPPGQAMLAAITGGD